MRKLHNQRGSALLASLISVTVLLILFLSAFSYGVARYGRYVKAQAKLRSQYLAEAGINRCLSMLRSGQKTYPQLMQTPLEIVVDSFNSYTVAVRPFGAYLLFTSTGKTGASTRVMQAVIGKEPDTALDNAVVLTNDQFPLTISGHTSIEGNILSGPIEITAGQIDARTTCLDSAIAGTHIIDPVAAHVSCSTAFISEYLRYVIEKATMEGYAVDAALVLQKDDGQFLDEHKTVHIGGNLEITDLIYSTGDTTITILVDGSAVVRGHSRLEGPIEIIAKRYVRLEDSASVSGGVCYGADSVIISDDCRFSAQAIAEGAIRVSDHASVTYPSALISLAGAARSEDSAAISLTSRRPLSSICMLMSNDSGSSRPQGKIYIDTGVVFTGVLFSAGYIDLRGTVFGSAVTSDFWHYAFPTEYINWLVDTRISRGKLVYQPVMPMGYGRHPGLRPLMLARR